MAPADSRFDVDVSLDPDPVIEAYKKDVDRTLIRENLKLTPEPEGESFLLQKIIPQHRPIHT